MYKQIYQRLGLWLFLLTLSVHAFGQSIQISGQITEENGEPIPGASVLVKGTTVGTAADLDGRYTLSAPGNGTLVFTCIGYESQEVNVLSRSNINVKHKTTITDLPEVVVVSYGTQQRSALTAAVYSVKSEKLTAYPAIDAVQAMQGRAAGIKIQ